MSPPGKWLVLLKDRYPAYISKGAVPAESQHGSSQTKRVRMSCVLCAGDGGAELVAKVGNLEEFANRIQYLNPVCKPAHPVG